MLLCTHRIAAWFGLKGPQTIAFLPTPTLVGNVKRCHANMGSCTRQLMKIMTMHKSLGMLHQPPGIFGKDFASKHL